MTFIHRRPATPAEQDAIDHILRARGGWLFSDDPMTGTLWLYETQHGGRVIGISEPNVAAPGLTGVPDRWLICLYADRDSDRVVDEYTGDDADEAFAFVHTITKGDA